MTIKIYNDPDDVICSCSGTKRRDIKRLFLEGADQAAISQRTGALTGCAGCEWDIGEYLHELTEEVSQAEQQQDNK